MIDDVIIVLGLIGKLCCNSVDWCCNEMRNEQWRVDTLMVAIHIITQNIPSFFNWIERGEQPERNMQTDLRLVFMCRQTSESSTFEFEAWTQYL